MRSVDHVRASAIAREKVESDSVRRLAEGRLGKAAAAFSSNARNPSLRRAQLSFLGAWTAEWAFTVGLGIVAYRDGGATPSDWWGCSAWPRPRSWRRCCRRWPTGAAGSGC